MNKNEWLFSWGIILIMFFFGFIFEYRNVFVYGIIVFDI